MNDKLPRFWTLGAFDQPVELRPEDNWVVRNYLIWEAKMRMVWNRDKSLSQRQLTLGERRVKSQHRSAMNLKQRIAFDRSEKIADENAFRNWLRTLMISRARAMTIIAGHQNNARAA